MTPGDKTPGRYRMRSRLSASVLALIAAGASTPLIYQQFLGEKEGTRLEAYQDGARIWTICSGLTRIYDRPVTREDKLTAQECADLDAKEQAKGLEEMKKLVRPEVWDKMSPAAQAGTASFCAHNIGIGKCRDSTFLLLLNEGMRNEACAQITRWIRDGGKDCRDRSNGCFGQVERRAAEDELCLQGVAG
jgi:lysozyme